MKRKHAGIPARLFSLTFYPNKHTGVNYFSHPHILILPHFTFGLLFIVKPLEESCILRVSNSFPLYSL